MAIYPHFEEDLPYLKAKYQRDVCDPSTGLSTEELEKGLEELAAGLAGLPRPVAKGRAFAYVCDHVRIDVPENDWYVAFGCWNRHRRPLAPMIYGWSAEADRESPARAEKMVLLDRVGAATIWKDFDHSGPDWDAVFDLGFPGLLARVRESRRAMEEKDGLSPRAAAFYDGLELTGEGMVALTRRFLSLAESRRASGSRAGAMADALRALLQGPPRSTYEALTLILLYFFMGEHIDHYQVRTLGNLDCRLLPFVRDDLAAGRYTEDEIREFIGYFMMQFASIDNYWGHPFYLCGTKADGTSEYNEVTRMILEEYDKLALHTPKIQIKVAPNTPKALWDQALDMIRRGHSSIAFLCEPGIERTMTSVGVSPEEARCCDIRGCYECAPRGSSNTTAPAYLNLLKPLELLFEEGRDPMTGLEYGPHSPALESLGTFEDFFAAYLRRLDDTVEEVIACCDDFERTLQDINPSQVLSMTISSSLEKAKDAFANGSKYNFSSLLLVGLASITDSLVVIRDYVFRRGELTLTALRDILRSDWAGHEKLRLRIWHDRAKYGNGLEEVDEIAARIARHLSEKVNGRPNAREGLYLLSGHSAKQYADLGRKTGATPDGRKAGDEMSKNLSPVQGADRSGVTALVRSLSRMEPSWFPGDFCLDVMMHPATVRGEDGLSAMRGLVLAYMRQGGVAIHFNIFDPETLRDAQAHPERYQGLQVRVCGWNILFNDMPVKEQDAFIRRAEEIVE